MKKLIRLITVLCIAFYLAACSPRAPAVPPAIESATEAASEPEPWAGNSPLFYVQEYDGGLRGRLLGEINDYQIRGFDPALISIDGNPLSDEVRAGLQYDTDGSPAYAASSMYAPIGQEFQLYDLASGRLAGNCRLVSAQYFYEGASGSDTLEAGFEPPGLSESTGYLAVTGIFDMQPRKVDEQPSEGGDGRYHIMTADIDNDGMEEIISWDMTTRG
ncbi:MAG: hypothetical protein FWG37_03120, partial [Clostridia bacterium]|nr:hypothetical protein [Clostridia bacterium]